MSILWKIGFWLLAVIAVLFSIWLVYHHYTNLVAENVALQKDKTALEVAVATQQQTIDAQSDAINNWSQNARRMQVAIEQLAAAQEEARQQTKELTHVLSKHNLRKLSQAKPQLIESRINRGTDDLFRMFREATGGADGASRDHPATGGSDTAPPSSGDFLVPGPMDSPDTEQPAG